MASYKLTPADLMARIQQGHDFWQKQMKLSRNEWQAYVRSEGTTPPRARQQVSMAKALYRDPLRDFNRLREIAMLHIPYAAMIRACGETVTDEQRETYFTLYESQNDMENIDKKEAMRLFYSVMRPKENPKTLELLSFDFLEKFDDQEEDQPPTNGQSKYSKMSIYLTTEQMEKLDDLTVEHRKTTGNRTNRNDVIRMLIDNAAIGSQMLEVQQQIQSIADKLLGAKLQGIISELKDLREIN